MDVNICNLYFFYLFEFTLMKLGSCILVFAIRSFRKPINVMDMFTVYCIVN